MKAYRMVCIALGATVACSRSTLGVDDFPAAPVGTSGQPLLCQPGDPPVVLVHASFEIFGNLAIGATRASWWTMGDGAVYTVPLTGGPAAKIATGPDDPQFDGRVLFRGDDVLWSGDAKSFDWSGGNGGWIRVVPPGGAPTTVLQKLDDPVLLSATSDGLTWVTSTATAGASVFYSYSIARRAADGAITTAPVAPPAGVVGDAPLRRRSTALTGSTLVWATTDAVAATSLTDGTSTVLARGAPWIVAADAANAYWLDAHTGGAALVRVPLAGGVAPTILVPELRGFVLGVADGAAYFEDGRSIVKLSLADGARSTVLDTTTRDDSPKPPPAPDLVAAYGQAADIAFDASCVYIAYQSAIVRLPK